MKKQISFLLALVTAMGSVAFSAQNEFVAADWAMEELENAQKAEIIPETLLKENLTTDISRADFARVLVTAYEKMTFEEMKLPAEKPFTDCEDTEVLKAYNEGFITGMGGGLFMPEELLTREQAATMLTRIYKSMLYPEWTIENDDEIALEFEKNSEFADDEEISDWAAEVVYFMADNNILKGVDNNKFAPKNNITKEQAIITALRFKNFIEAETEYNPDPYQGVDRGDMPEKEAKENEYVAAFIGGSLTAGGSQWINKTKNFLQEKMPDKKVKIINAGIGGTTSAYGAARFMNNVGQYNPDVVFIEFAVNDTTMSSENEQIMYMESMIRQSQKLPKEPNIVFLYAPNPVDTDSDIYKEWEAGVKLKEKLANYYGIGSINIYAYMQRDYKAVKDEKGYTEYNDYLETMYSRSGSGFDVHGGYAKYGEAIVEALSRDYDKYMKAPKNKGVYCTAEKKLVEAQYQVVSATSPRMIYGGEWKTYTNENKFETTDSKITIGGLYNFPYFENGIKQVENTDGAFGFNTTASAICVNFISATAGNSAKVYVDEVQKGTITCNSQYHGMSYITDWISLPKDGKTHKVIFVVDSPTTDKYVFRFGTVIERFEK